MPVQKINIDEFRKLATQFPVLDVRSPGEYKKAHIPGAYSLPLFTDEERKVVGTAYKQESREKAIKIGLQYFGVKMVQMVEEAEALVISHKVNKSIVNSELVNDLMINDQITNYNKTVLVHCWRGGMRSAGVAWLLDLYGFKVYSLIGGYKTYRNWCVSHWEKDFNFCLVGGYTGSGKTKVLKSLENKDEVIIDLEALACHRGSAFGSLGQPEQPSQEMYENLLAEKLATALEISNKKNKMIWLEDESQRIGNINTPASLFKTMREKPVLFLDIPFEKRLEEIISSYGTFKKEELASAIERIQKRLGGLETKNALLALEENDLATCFQILLKYYDKLYLKSMKQRENWEALMFKIESNTTGGDKNAALILNAASKINSNERTTIN
ncbi:MAG: tRNA 2-selenouridine(34) synthase MnmH [Chitinophagaceae bacterium]|nr:tRNA 2-selenouridine(34) synthase MnmH [Chitinophagaceae bacterium]